MKKSTSTLRSKKSKKSKKIKETLIPILKIEIDNELDEDVDIVDEIKLDEEMVDSPTSLDEEEEEEVEEVKPKKIKPKDREHYVNGKEFEEEIRNFYNTDNITINLGECINKIANGLSYAPNFINYSYKEEMVGDAIVKMFSALKNKKFKLDSGFSPFSYFTTIAFHAFINRIKKEKKHHKAITEYREKVYNELMHDPNETGGAHIYVDPGCNEYDD
jgi:hypothetical protein